MLLAGLAAVACNELPAPPPSFVIVSIDTLRADHMGLYGYERDTTPRLDALLRRALVFDAAWTTAENTLVAHASLFTGLNAETHGVTHREGGRALAPAFTTFAEELLAAGWQTAGFAAHGDWLTPAFGMDQGFETFSSSYRDGDEVLDEARAWLDARDRTRPFLLFVHLFDVHSDRQGRPYGAPAAFAGRWSGDYSGAWQAWQGRLQGSSFLRAVMDGTVTLDPVDVQHLVDQYDEGLAATDDVLGLFLGGLPDDVRDQAFLVVTADHGEEFMEHGLTLHSSLFEPVARVPLVLVPPSGHPLAARAPRRITEPVGLVDVRPTLRALAGLAAPDAGDERDVQGASLVKWLLGERDPPRRVLSLYQRAIRVDDVKLMQKPGGWLLFDLGADPGERSDLSGDPAWQDALAGLRQRLAAVAADDRLVRLRILGVGDGEGGGPAPVADPESEQRLRELGYVK